MSMQYRVEKLIKKIKLEFRNRKNYYKTGREQIAATNLKVLLLASIVAVVLLLTFLAVTPLIIRDWHATVYHIMFFPALLGFCIVVSVYYSVKKECAPARTVTVLCVLFIVLLDGFCVLIDSVGASDAPGTFTSMMFIILPAIFILPFLWIYGVIAVLEVLYIVAIIVFKDERIGQYDIFGSVVALLCSVIVANIITHLRVRDYSVQSRYKMLSMTDSLTGIQNKGSSLDALEEYLNARNHNTSCILILMDLDDFKRINDTLGHDVGDIILGHAGKTLCETFRQTDIIGRFGGDEFIIVVKNAWSRELIQRKCKVIQEKLAQRSEADTGVTVSCSFGAIIVRGNHGNVHSIFAQADAALYETKRAGKAHCIVREYNESGGGGKNSENSNKFWQQEKENE